MHVYENVKELSLGSNCTFRVYTEKLLGINNGSTCTSDYDSLLLVLQYDYFGIAPNIIISNISASICYLVLSIIAFVFCAI